jgi:hypothetical protein
VIPELPNSLLRNIVCKNTCKPLHSEHAHVNFKFTKLLGNFWKFFSNHIIEDSLIDYSSKDVTIIVYWKNGLNQLHESPESFFFRHKLKKPTNNKVKALSITNLGISIDISSTNSLKSFLLSFVKPIFMWKRSHHINFDLSPGWRGVRERKS